MVKRLAVLLLVAGFLMAYEDVSFSARSLGLGGLQQTLTGDLFSNVANPALGARQTRTGVGLSVAPYQSNIYWTAGFIQPVKSLGNIGGILLRNLPYELTSYKSGLYLFWAVPIGKSVNIGTAIGDHSMSVGLSYSGPKGIIFGISFREVDIDFSFMEPAIVNPGVCWSQELRRVPVLSSVLVGVDGRFSTDGSINFSTGAEGFFFNDILGLRAGLNYDDEDGLSPAFGASLRTYRVEQTDFELHYGMSAISNNDTASILHQITFNVLFGDARKEEKDSILSAQAERAQKLREQNLARERDRLSAELDEIAQERSALEAERADIERLRQEALTSIGRIAGVRYSMTDSTTTIIVDRTGLEFGDDSEQIPFPEGFWILDRIASFLAQYPRNKVSILVHCNEFPQVPEDEEAEPLKYSTPRALTSARAKVIRQYFVEVKELSASLVSARGAGTSALLLPQDPTNPSNNRVEITVYR